MIKHHVPYPLVHLCPLCPSHNVSTRLFQFNKRACRSFLPILCLTFVVTSGDSTLRFERVVGRNGVVATDETECSKIGRDILKRGGHAVDAAVAATLCIGVVSPAESGLGGGGFILIRPAKGAAEVFDMREIAPGQASKDMFSNMTEFEWKISPLSIAVPGQLAGLYTVHQKYGKLEWGSLVKPAKNLAHTGFKVSQTLSQKLASLESHIMADEELKKIFAPNGVLRVEGQTLRLRKLADTLSTIAKEGMNVFYNGSIAQSLVEDIQKRHGIVKLDDMKKYRVVKREPLIADVMGSKLLTVPPPASGGAVVILILKTLSKFNNTDVSPSLLVHRTIEALKYALALRMDLGDPSFVNITSVLNYIISDNAAERIRNLIDDNKTFDPAHYGSKWSQMYDFSIPTSKVRPGAPANYVSPFKRPLSSMAPIILEKDGRVRAVIGSAGGLLIPDAVSQVLLNFFVRKKHILNSVMAPRFYHRLYPNVVLHESYSSFSGDRYAYSNQTLAVLKKKGHHLKPATSMMTTCQFVIQTLNGERSGQLVAVSDPRKGGFPAGY